MGVFSTVEGFGTNDDFSPEANPLLEDTGLRWTLGPDPNGKKIPVLANDLFRAVHDTFGHGLEGASFRARGEENAWQAHVRLFTGSALGALTSETRGQNSWLNFGPHGEANRTAKSKDTVFADQKTGLMPEWTWTEGRVGDMGEPLFSRKSPEETRTEIEKFIDEERKLGTSDKEIRSAIEEVAQDPNSGIDAAMIDEMMKTTGIKNVVTEAERAERGLKPVEVEAKRSFGKVFDTAKEKVASGEMNGLTLATEIASKPRPLSAEESAVLLIDRMRISNEYNKKTKELIDAQNKGDKDAAEIIQSQLEVLEQEMDLNDEAARKSGYEQGLGLAARKMMIAQDYSLVNQMNRLKAANGGKEVPKEYQEKLKDLTGKLDEALLKLEEVEKKLAANEKAKEIKQTKKLNITADQFYNKKVSIKDKILNKWNAAIGKLKEAAKPKEGEIGRAHV